MRSKLWFKSPCRELARRCKLISKSVWERSAILVVPVFNEILTFRPQTLRLDPLNIPPIPLMGNLTPGTSLLVYDEDGYLSTLLVKSCFITLGMSSKAESFEEH